MKKSEKQLLYILVSLALLGALVVCSDIYLEKRELLTQERTNLQNEWIEIETLFEERSMWELRGQWLEQNQPTFTNNQAIAQAIFERAEKPRTSGITTSRLSLIPASETPFFSEVGVSFNAEGELGSILRWLYDMTPPSSFRFIRNIRLTPSAEEPQILSANIELLRWYTPSES
tara:strand:+ start:555 stop:1076 length:522 start_codon:yes stop_codon:yes gene_type:complete